MEFLFVADIFSMFLEHEIYCQNFSKTKSTNQLDIF